MVHHYVLDTSVLLHDPDALFAFQDNHLYIPEGVLEELDKFKMDPHERGFSARQTIRNLEVLTQEGIPREGIALRTGGKLFFHLPIEGVEYKKQESEVRQMSGSYADNMGIMWGKMLRKKFAETTEAIHPQDVAVVSKDLNLRLRARRAGVLAEDYQHDKAQLDLHDFFQRDSVYTVSENLLQALYRDHSLPLPDSLKLEENQYVALRGDEGGSALALQRNGQLELLRKLKPVEDIRPRNKEQEFFLHACLDPNLSIVSGLGMAGTGKTLLALAAGIHQVIGDESRRYQKILVIRPLLEAGKEIGFLPGEVGEKIEPYFSAVDTALRLVLGDAGAEYPGKDEWIKYRPINYVRGETFDDTYIIVDEAQNFTPREIKLIGTRIGNRSKLVMLGDPFQRDNPYLDERDNGLTHVTDLLRRKKLPNFTYIILHKVERSEEARIFAEIL